MFGYVWTAKVTDTALGTIRSLEVTGQGFEERAVKLEAATYNPPIQKSLSAVP